MSSHLTVPFLKDRATKIMDFLVNSRDDSTSVRPLIHPTAKFEHDDHPAFHDREILFNIFKQVHTAAPDMRCKILDCIAEVNDDGKSGRAWVFTEISNGMAGRSVASVDMMTFDEQGMLVASKDVQRELAVEK